MPQTITSRATDRVLVQLLLLLLLSRVVGRHLLLLSSGRRLAVDDRVAPAHARRNAGNTQSTGHRFIFDKQHNIGTGIKTHDTTTTTSTRCTADLTS